MKFLFTLSFLIIYREVFYYFIGGNYLNYLFSLNYWNSNTLTLLLFLGLTYPINISSLYIFLLLKFLVTKLLSHTLWKQALVSTLYIGTLAIHPLLFYTSLLSLLIRIVYRRCPYAILLHNITFSRLLYTLILTLLLGGFWGFQSTIWGYFWVNDAVEWLLLLATIYIVCLLHTLTRGHISVNKFLILISLFSSILLVRLNLVPTRHNFIQNINLSYTAIFCTIALIFCYWNVTVLSFVNGSQVICTVCFFFLSFSLIVTKYVQLILLVFVLKHFKPKVFRYTLNLHITLTIFFLVWGVFFTFFHLFYKLGVEFLKPVIAFTNYLNFSSNYIFSGLKGLELLEAVDISLSTQPSRQFPLLNNYGGLLMLNNCFLGILCFFFFIM